MTDREPQIGDNVKITNSGEIYPSYFEMAINLKLEYFNFMKVVGSDIIKEGMVGVIVAKGKHLQEENRMVYGVRLILDDNNPIDIIIGYEYTYGEQNRGFIVTSTPNLFDDNLFEV